ncbi:MAG: hypothetical protein DWQ49_09605 [Bacteroidetes bacterium]|nr:MAG: hypothetical protein DWQ49_09605 [Bacteroidota bacterium]
MKYLYILAIFLTGCYADHFKKDLEYIVTRLDKNNRPIESYVVEGSGLKFNPKEDSIVFENEQGEKKIWFNYEITTK